MSNINVKQGVNFIGMIYNDNVPIKNIPSGKITAIKRQVNGVWESHTPNTPEEFQKFTILEKGKGYIVASNSEVDIPTNGKELNFDEVNITKGLSTYAFPFGEKPITVQGHVPRMKVKTLKRFFNNRWETWVLNGGLLQDFTSLNSGGYICDVEELTDSYIYKTNKSLFKGVMIEKLEEDNPNVKNYGQVTGLPEDYSLKLFSHHDEIVLSGNRVKSVITVEGTLYNIEFPIEYTGHEFTLAKTRLLVIDCGKLTDPVTKVIDCGKLTDPVNETIDCGYLINRDFIIDTEYNFKFKQSTIPLNPTAVYNNKDLEIMYNSVSIAGTSSNVKEMTISVAGIKAKIWFSPEYVGREFRILKNDKTYLGTFMENNIVNVIGEENG